jgi:hypothetical protein
MRLAELVVFVSESGEILGVQLPLTLPEARDIPDYIPGA